jgi:hypothetical protein
LNYQIPYVVNRVWLKAAGESDQLTRRCLDRALDPFLMLTALFIDHSLPLLLTIPYQLRKVFGNSDTFFAPQRQNKASQTSFYILWFRRSTHDWIDTTIRAPLSRLHTVTAMTACMCGDQRAAWWGIGSCYFSTPRPIRPSADFLSKATKKLCKATA